LGFSDLELENLCKGIIERSKSIEKDCQKYNLPFFDLSENWENLVTLTSVGAGALGVTALLIIYPKRPINTIIGSDIAHAVPLTLVAGLGHASIGTVDYKLLGILLIGSLPGIWIGSHLSSKIAEHWVRIALALILIFVGFKLVFN